MKIVFARALRGGVCSLTLFFLAHCGGDTAANVENLASAGEAALETNACNLTGTWAVKFGIPVRWSPSIVVSGGGGTVHQWLKAVRTHSGDTYTDSLSLCGISSPDSKTRPLFGSEKYGIVFPNELFDSGVLPGYEARARLSSADAGIAYQADPLTVLIGMDMPNAALASWPTSKAMTTLDSDKDGLPGITINVRLDDGYTAPPVNMWPPHKRAAKFYIALRNVVEEAHGLFTDCDHAKGTVTIPIIDKKLAINSRVLGCVRTDGVECAPGEYEMVDKQSSGYDLNGVATMEMVRVPDNATCATIRAL